MIFHGVGTGLLLVSFLHLSHRAEITFPGVNFTPVPGFPGRFRRLTILTIEF